MPKITRLTAITFAALSTQTTVSRDTDWPTYLVGNLIRSELERTFVNPPYVNTCPGWSQSGRTCVRPGESQRFFAFTDTVVTVGENPLKIRHARHNNYLSDMAVIARPADDYRNISADVDGNANSLAIDAPWLTLRSVEPTTNSPVRGEFTISAYTSGERKPVKIYQY